MYLKNFLISIFNDIFEMNINFLNFFFVKSCIYMHFRRQTVISTLTSGCGTTPGQKFWSRRRKQFFTCVGPRPSTTTSGYATQTSSPPTQRAALFGTASATQCVCAKPTARCCFWCSCVSDTLATLSIVGDAQATSTPAFAKFVLKGLCVRVCVRARQEEDKQLIRKKIVKVFSTRSSRCSRPQTQTEDNARKRFDKEVTLSLSIYICT